MDEKKQKKLINRSIKLLNGKNGHKICSFLSLAKALKISKNTLQNYGLNKSTEIINLIAINRHEKKLDKKLCKKSKKSSAKTVQNKNQKLNKNNLLRPYEEIKAKLFGYKAWKHKHYKDASPNAKTIIDRQIALLEWVMNQDQENKEGEINAN